MGLEDAQFRCPACSAHYTEPHQSTCLAVAERAREIAKYQARKSEEEAARGEKIAEGEEGIYAIDDLDPVIVAYNEGGYNSTVVRVSVILDWLRKRRPELLK